jgi:hypothetical protein
MPNPRISPAAQSAKLEQAAQEEQSLKGDLDKGLEDTFPGSDPVSATHGAAPAGRAYSDEADRARGQPDKDEDYPLVEQALRFTGEGRRSTDSSDAGRHNVRALRRHAGRIAETASEVASGTAFLAKTEARSFIRNIEDRIRDQPIAAVAFVAVLAFIFGATR